MKKDIKKVELFDSKLNCCGCGACSNICPQNIIKMNTDEEGFLYPKITELDKCVGCGKCESICPVLHADEIHSQFTEAFAGWCLDGSGIKSASGGAAYVIARNVILNGGVVYGVKYTDDCKAAVYFRGASEEDIEKMRTSKYIQARKNDVFKSIKSDLNSGKRVLFLGLPCDTFAVKKYTESCDGLLITVSLICHGPTSETVHKAYCEEIEKKYRSKLLNINVRYKKNNHWKPYYIHACFSSGNEHLKKFQATDYDVAFQQFKRPSCTACHFKNDNYCSDILIGDFHSAQKGTESYNDTGVSSILPLTSVGREIVSKIQDEFVLNKVDLECSISQRAIHSSAKSNIDRYAFTKLLNNSGLAVACKHPSVLREKRKTRKRRTIFFCKSLAYKILKYFRIV